MIYEIHAIHREKEGRKVTNGKKGEKINFNIRKLKISWNYFSINSLSLNNFKY